jgi:hypothetical protein
MVCGLLRLVAVFVVAPSWTSPARACPLCESETGERVRAGIFNAEFGYNLLVTLLPFSVLLAIVALIHFGLPWANDPHRGDPAPRLTENETPVRPTGEDQSWTKG